jgi:hypothetical protein
MLPSLAVVLQQGIVVTSATPVVIEVLSKPPLQRREQDWDCPLKKSRRKEKITTSNLFIFQLAKIVKNPVIPAFSAYWALLIPYR